MKKVALVILLVFAGFGVFLFFPESEVSYPLAELEHTIEIAPLEEALTFARVSGDDGSRLIAVTRYEDGEIGGYDLTALLESKPVDPIALFNEVGYGGLVEKIAAFSVDQQQSYSTADLGIPVDLTSQHVAAGTNFAAHAEESNVEEGPFLFAKMVEPTPFDGPICIDEGLLDFEVELAYVTLEAAPLDAMPEYMGLVVTNDFTNRAKLLWALDPDDVISGKGFTTGKSAPGFMPVGTLFVIPRDYRAFSMGLEMRLTWNDVLRQSAPTSQMIWDIDEIFKQVAARDEVLWDYEGEQVGLPIEDGALPARTLILAGTPEGTIFQGPTTQLMAKGALRWLFGGWEQSLVDNVIDYYIDDRVERKSFAQPGDVIHAQIDHVGEVITTVESP